MGPKKRATKETRSTTKSKAPPMEKPKVTKRSSSNHVQEQPYGLQVDDVLGVVLGFLDLGSVKVLQGLRCVSSQWARVSAAAPTSDGDVHFPIAALRMGLESRMSSARQEEPIPDGVITQARHLEQVLRGLRLARDANEHRDSFAKLTTKFLELPAAINGIKDDAQRLAAAIVVAQFVILETRNEYVTVDGDTPASNAYLRFSLGSVEFLGFKQYLVLASMWMETIFLFQARKSPDTLAPVFDTEGARKENFRGFRAAEEAALYVGGDYSNFAKRQYSEEQMPTVKALLRKTEKASLAGAVDAISDRTLMLLLQIAFMASPWWGERTYAGSMFDGMKLPKNVIAGLESA